MMAFLIIATVIFALFTLLVVLAWLFPHAMEKVLPEARER